MVQIFFLFLKMVLKNKQLREEKFNFFLQKPIFKKWRKFFFKMAPNLFLENGAIKKFKKWREKKQNNCKKWRKIFF